MKHTLYPHNHQGDWLCSCGWVFLGDATRQEVQGHFDVHVKTAKAMDKRRHAHMKDPIKLDTVNAINAKLPCRNFDVPYNEPGFVVRLSMREVDALVEILCEWMDNGDAR